MNEILQQKLFNDFPKIYKKGESPRHYFFFGFECGDGWFDLLYTLSENIDDIMIESDEISVTQVKEKFGDYDFTIFLEARKILHLLIKLFILTFQCG